MPQDQLTKLASVPAWLLDMFSRIDKKDFQGARNYMADDVVIEFAHYIFKGAEQLMRLIPLTQVPLDVVSEAGRA